MNNGADSKKSSPTVPLFSRFQTRLVLLVLLVSVPAIVLTIYTNLHRRQTQKNQVKESTVALARLAAANEENFVKNTRQLLASVTQAPFLVLNTNRRASEVHFINLRKLSPDYVDFGLIEADGTLFCSAALTNGSRNLSDQAFFQRVGQTKRFAIGDFQTNLLTGTPTLDFGYPILNDRGELQRVLYASLDLPLLSKVASDVQLPAGATLTVFDRKGNVLAHYPEPDKWVGQSLAGEPFVRRILTGNTDVFEMRGLNEKEKLFAATPISDGLDQALFVTIGIPTQSVFADANQALVRNIIVLGIITTLGLLLSHFYGTHSLVRPMRSLVVAARELASGRLDARANVSQSSGELAELARAFNDMAETLERRQKELQAAHAEVNRMNLELEQRVKARTAELQEVNEELEAFSYSVSHDLRAPLRHIGGFSELLRHSPDVKMGDEGRRHLDIISGSSTKMEKLIDGLLQFSRMGKDGINVVELNMEEIVEQAVAEISLSAVGRNISWNIAPLPKAYADPQLLKQVWLNLLSNAVKYTCNREKAEITIGSRRHEGEIEFFVRDNGSGFDMKYANKLFGVFQRLHSEREFEGTGIGLANVRRIIQRHGGRTWAEAKVDEGATFYFTLPISTPKLTSSVAE